MEKRKVKKVNTEENLRIFHFIKTPNQHFHCVRLIQKINVNFYQQICFRYS